MSKPAARIGDLHTCPMVDPGPKPHVGGPILEGCPTVSIGGLPAARVGDKATCMGPPDIIAQGASEVIIGYKPAARLGDATAHGGVIVAGCPTVLIGGDHQGIPVATGSVADTASEEKTTDSGTQEREPASDIGNDPVDAVEPVELPSDNGNGFASDIPDAIGALVVRENRNSIVDFAGKVTSGKSWKRRRAALNILGKLWALPNTLIGLAYGGVGMLFGATPMWDSQAGVLRFIDMPGWMMRTAISLGHVNLFGPGMYKMPDGTLRPNGYGSTVMREELLHTRQAEILGPLYLPLHIVSMTVSLLTSGDTHKNNPLEIGPQSGKGPWPWN